VVDAADVTMSAVCFGSCTACPVGLEDVDAASWLVYPNPASDRLNLVGLDAGQTIDVYNSFGQRHATIYYSGSTSMDISSWPNGIYTLKAASGEIARILVH
ncbi:MAG: T9SS type A sorting domain-containing protein, partial [Flavobacteriales bacterium]